MGQDPRIADWNGPTCPLPPPASALRSRRFGAGFVSARAGPGHERLTPLKRMVLWFFVLCSVRSLARNHVNSQHLNTMILASLPS